MRGRPFGIDHLMVRVPDSERAGHVFETLGFTVTPRSTMPGLSNRLVCFPSDDPRGASFIELISVDDPDLAPEPVIDLLGFENGPAAVVVATDDAEGLAVELSGQPGVLPARDFSRSWELGDRRLDLSFSVLIARRGSAPLSWSAIQHRTPEHYRAVEFLHHPAGSFRLSAILAQAPEPIEAAGAFKVLWGATALADSPRLARVPLGPCELRVQQPEVIADRTPRVLGFALATDQPDRTAESFIARFQGFSHVGGRRFRLSSDGWSCIVELTCLGTGL